MRSHEQIMDNTTYEDISIESNEISCEISDAYISPEFAIGFEQSNRFYLFAKRLFDITACLAILIISLPIMLVLAILIKLTSKGPVIYKQERLGKNGKPFIIYKFRTMRNDAEKDGAVWASEDDPRVTAVGKIMRKSRLDELPQLVNIIKGDMSIVGPRPEREIFYDEFEKTIPFFRERLYVKPGLTGWAQVNGGYNLKPSEKIIYDIEYIQKRNFLFDLKCIMLTFKVLFTWDGAR